MATLLHPSPADIDELGDLDDWYRSVKPKIDRRDALKKRIASCYENRPAALAFEAAGKRYRVSIAACEMERRIANMAGVRKALGLPLFTRLASITLKNLDAHLALVDQVRLKLTTQERTGSRKVTVMAIAGTPVAEPASRDVYAAGEESKLAA